MLRFENPKEISRLVSAACIGLAAVALFFALSRLPGGLRALPLVAPSDGDPSVWGAAETTGDETGDGMVRWAIVAGPPTVLPTGNAHAATPAGDHLLPLPTPRGSDLR